MKKKITLCLALLAMLPIGASAQTTYNLFPKSDVDADGWLWLDSEEKIEKYVGTINDDDYRVDPNGKVIQMVYANQQPDYPPTEADANIQGAGTDGETGSAGCRTGALVLQPAKGFGSVNGGGFVVCLPSCATYAICYSSNSKINARIVATNNANADMTKTSNSETPMDTDEGWHVISAKYVSVFNTMPKGINNWNGIEKLNNNDNITIAGDKPVYVWFQSSTRDTVYIHGIKVTTPKEQTLGIDRHAWLPNGHAPQAVYTIDGRRMDDKAALQPGLYIVTTNKGNRKVVVR